MGLRYEFDRRLRPIEDAVTRISLRERQESVTRPLMEAIVFGFHAVEPSTARCNTLARNRNRNI
jgi:hypothetical protein